MIRAFTFLLMLVLLFNVFGDCLGPLVHHLAHSFDQTNLYHDHDHHADVHHHADGHVHHHAAQAHEHGMFVSIMLKAFDLSKSEDTGRETQFLSLKMMSIHGLIPGFIPGLRSLGTLLPQSPIGPKWHIGIPELDVLIPPPKY